MRILSGAPGEPLLWMACESLVYIHDGANLAVVDFHLGDRGGELATFDGLIARDYDIRQRDRRGIKYDVVAVDTVDKENCARIVSDTAAFEFGDISGNDNSEPSVDVCDRAEFL